jgi:hypothetical protein
MRVFFRLPVQQIHPRFRALRAAKKLADYSVLLGFGRFWSVWTVLLSAFSLQLSAFSLASPRPQGF